MSRRDEPPDAGDLYILRHALGLTRSTTAYRNHFVAERGSGDYGVCRDLESRGLMECSGATPLTGTSDYEPMFTFRVTDAGRVLAAVADGAEP